MNLTLEQMRTATQDALDRWGVQYTARFVPQSMSRNKKSKNRSINWEVTFKRDGRELATDYMQGIGHAPKPPKFSGWDWMDAESYANGIVEKGVGYYGFRPYKVTPPHPADVLAGLLLDARAAEHPVYESWAMEFGYSEDSREGERAYNACRQIAADLARVFKEKERRTLAHILADY